jgi:hypothetical protein
LVVADFHIGDRCVGMETDAHLLHRFGQERQFSEPSGRVFDRIGPGLDSDHPRPPSSQKCHGDSFDHREFRAFRGPKIVLGRLFVVFRAFRGPFQRADLAGFPAEFEGRGGAARPV